MDDDHGYDARAAEYFGGRSRTIGVATVLAWARQLRAGAAVLDLGCGHGDPIAVALVDAGFAVHGVDASPQMVAAFRVRLPGVPVRCESALRSTFFDRSFDAVVAWGVVFLFDETEQARLVEAAARALVPGGRLIFTAPWQTATWTDVLTGRTSRSLGRDAYQRLLDAAGMDLVGEGDDEGGNHYFSAIKR